MNPAPLDVELCERSLEQATIQSNYIQSGPKFFVQPLSEKLCEDLVSKMGNFKKERRLETIDEHSRNVFWKVQQKEDLSKEVQCFILFSKSIIHTINKLQILDLELSGTTIFILFIIILSLYLNSGGGIPLFKTHHYKKEIL